MSAFFVGQRVRIVKTERHPTLLGAEGRIIGPYRRAHNKIMGEWFGWPLDILSPDGKRVVAKDGFIEPILPSGHRPAELTVEELLPFLRTRETIDVR